MFLKFIKKYWQLAIFLILLIPLIIAIGSGCSTYKKLAQYKVENEELTIRLKIAQGQLTEVTKSFEALQKIEPKTDTILVNTEKIIKVVVSNNQILDSIMYKINNIQKDIDYLKLKTKLLNYERN